MIKANKNYLFFINNNFVNLYNNVMHYIVNNNLTDK